MPKTHPFLLALLTSLALASCSDDSTSDGAPSGSDAGLDGSAGTGGAGGAATGGTGATSGSGGTGGASDAAVDASGPCGTWVCSGDDCLDLVPMPGSDDPSSTEAQEAGYFVAAEPRYAYIRKDLSMLLIWAACQMRETYPDIAPLALYDMSEQDGSTPGTDDGQPRHPPSTFENGTMFATAYYQTDGDNGMQNVCGDGSDEAACGTAGDFNDGFACTTTDTIVDLDQQRAFLELLAQHPDFAEMGVEQSVGETLDDSGLNVGYGVGWVCMHLFVSWAFELPELPNPCLSAPSCNACCFDENPAGEPIMLEAVHDCACGAESGCDDECAGTLCQATQQRPDDACMACAGSACLSEINMVCGSNPECGPLFSCMMDCIMNRAHPRK